MNIFDKYIILYNHHNMALIFVVAKIAATQNTYHQPMT